MSEESVQPEVVTEGQGAAPYSEYLDRLPEEIRGDVEPIFQEWDSNVTKRFQEAAEFRESMKPYQDLGIDQVPTDELQNLIALRDIAENSPEQFDEWLRATATERGLLDQTEPFEDYETDDRLSPLEQKIQAMEARFEQQEMEGRIAEAKKTIEAQMNEQSEKFPDVPRELVEQFLATFAESDPHNAVSLAYDAANKWIAQIQQQMVESKLKQPEAAEQGSATAPPEAIKSFKDAEAQVLARLRQNN
jgi:hypothetical protein